MTACTVIRPEAHIVPAGTFATAKSDVELRRVAQFAITVGDGHDLQKMFDDTVSGTNFKSQMIQRSWRARSLIECQREFLSSLRHSLTNVPL